MSSIWQLWHCDTWWYIPYDIIDIVTLGDMFQMTPLTSWHLVICSIWHNWHCDTWWYVLSDKIDIVSLGKMFHMIPLTSCNLVIYSRWYHWHCDSWWYVPYDIMTWVKYVPHGSWRYLSYDFISIMKLGDSYFFYDILWYYTFMWNSKFWLTEKLLIKFRLSILSSEPWQHALAHDSAWHWPILL